MAISALYTDGCEYYTYMYTASYCRGERMENLLNWFSIFPCIEVSLGQLHIVSVVYGRPTRIVISGDLPKIESKLSRFSLRVKEFMRHY